MKNGYFLAYNVETNYYPEGLVLVDTRFQKLVNVGDLLKVSVNTAHVWWK
jgi:hypothetical protein